MLDSGMLNLGSLILGIIALLLPLISLYVGKQQKIKVVVSLTILSLTSCATSLFFQIITFYLRVNASDWYALEDTVSVILSVPAIMFFVTLGLNAISLTKIRTE